MSNTNKPDKPEQPQNTAPGSYIRDGDAPHETVYGQAETWQMKHAQQFTARRSQQGDKPGKSPL